MRNKALYVVVVRNTPAWKMIEIRAWKVLDREDIRFEYLNLEMLKLRREKRRSLIGKRLI